MAVTVAMASNNKFTAQQDEMLVNLLANHSYIYDLESRDYKNAMKKEKTWESIAAMMEKDKEQCKKRWRNIKDTYYKNKKKRGSGSAASHKNKWHLMKHLSFLNNVKNERPSTSNMAQDSQYTDTQDTDTQTSSVNLEDNSQEDENSHTMVNCETHSTQSRENSLSTSASPVTTSAVPTTSKRSRFYSKYESFEKRAEARLDILRQAFDNNDKDEDDVDIFMKSIAKSVKKLPQHLIGEAKLKILATVTNLEFIANPPPSRPLFSVATSSQQCEAIFSPVNAESPAGTMSHRDPYITQVDQDGEMNSFDNL